MLKAIKRTNLYRVYRTTCVTVVTFVLHCAWFFLDKTTNLIIAWFMSASDNESFGFCILVVQFNLIVPITALPLLFLTLRLICRIVIVIGR